MEVQVVRPSRVIVIISINNYTYSHVIRRRRIISLQQSHQSKMTDANLVCSSSLSIIMTQGNSALISANDGRVYLTIAFAWLKEESILHCIAVKTGKLYFFNSDISASSTP